MNIEFDRFVSFSLSFLGPTSPPSLCEQTVQLLNLHSELLTLWRSRERTGNSSKGRCKSDAVDESSWCHLKRVQRQLGRQQQAEFSADRFGISGYDTVAAPLVLLMSLL
jgi:hypothetical protein